MRLYLTFILLAVTLNARAYKPEPEYWIRPDSLGLTYVEKRLTTPDKAELLSWFLPTPVSKPLGKTLLIAYAGTGNMANCVYYANAFLKAGFDVVLFDYRGFGHSSTFTVNPDQLYYNEYVTDMLTAVRAAKKEFPKNKVGILSFSMSTIMATLVAQREPVDFIIAEGFVQNPQAIAAFWKRQGNRIIILPEGVRSYAETIRNVKCPMLLIAGTEDLITTSASSKAVVAQRSNRQLLTFKGDHLQATQVWKIKEFADGYVKRIKEFVVKV